MAHEQGRRGVRHAIPDVQSEQSSVSIQQVNVRVLDVSVRHEHVPGPREHRRIENNILKQCIIKSSRVVIKLPSVLRGQKAEVAIAVKQEIVEQVVKQER